MKFLLLVTSLLLPLLFIPCSSSAQAPDLGTSSTFALFTAAGAFNNVGATTVIGDIGTNVGAFSGFPPGIVVGNIHVADAVSATAATDVAIAYSYLAGLTCGSVIGATLGNDQILTPDIYCLGEAGTLNGDLYLDAEGDPNAIFIFQIDGAFATNNNSQVILLNGATQCNVYWQINGQLTLGGNSLFVGTAIVSGAVILEFGATLRGRALSTAGAVSTNTNVVTMIPDCQMAPPVITCPPDVTVSCADLVPAALITDVVVLAECPGTITVTFDGDVIIDQTCPNQYSIIRTYGVIDACGATASCSQTIVVNDQVPPTMQCPVDITVQCSDDVPDPNTDAIIATDNCGGSPTITFVGDDISNQTCENNYTIMRTYQAMDDCGNSVTCTQQIIVLDNTAPVITCPADITLDCSADLPSPDPDAIISIDNCDGPTIISFIMDVTINQTCENNYTIARTYQAVDACGNTSTCIQQIIFSDTEAPSITCPENITVECSSQVPPPDIDGVTATDDCGGSVTITFSGDIIINQTCENSYTILRTYLAIDACGNSSTCSQSITVIDSTGPTITCPVDITVACTSLIPLPNEAGIITSDNCGGVPSASILADVTINQTCENSYTILRSYLVVDACGNSATCNQQITVVDTIPPSISCPVNITVDCAGSIPTADSSGIIAVDNCEGLSTISILEDIITNQSCENRFTVIRTYQVEDECGNSSTCVQEITVFDDTPPIITCPANITVECASLVPSADPDGLITADNCGGMTTIIFLGEIISNQTCENRYIITRTYQATDDCGNSTTCSYEITVFDDTPPSFICPVDITVECADQIPSPDASLIISTDNCDGGLMVTFVADVISSMTCENRFIITRSYQSVDSCGNTNICTQIITVLDNSAPSITCPADLTVGCLDEIPLPSITGILSVDNCAGTSVISIAGDLIIDQVCENQFTILRTYVATDSCGNSATCIQEITILDNIPPAFLCPGDITVECASLIPLPDPGSIVATDNCGGGAEVFFGGDTITNQTCENRLIITRTYLALDICGNSASCEQIITVIDNTLPSIICPADVTVQCINDVPVPETTSIVSTDNCGGVTTVSFLSDIITGQICENALTISRTYQALDECGNSATCTQVITVFDDIIPSLACPADVTVQCTGEIPLPNPDALISTDNCGGLGTVTFTGDVISDQVCSNRYTITRSYQVLDECGNSANCDQLISVFDNTAPSIECPVDITVACTSLVPVPDINAIISTDNCSGNPTITFISDVITNETCVNRYTLTRTYQASDECGNTSLCSQIITVFDDVIPSITCPANITVQCASMVPVPDINTIISTDNCGGTVTVTFISDIITNQTCENRFNITRTYQVIDACGNTAQCSQLITVFDNTAPILTCPSDMTVECAAQVPQLNLSLVSVIENCGTAIVTHMSDVITNQLCVNSFILTRIYLATDACGNTATCSQIITVLDDTPPEISFDDQSLFDGDTLEIQCFGQDSLWDLPVFDLNDIEVTDNCIGNITVTFSEVLMDEGNCTEDGYSLLYRLTWTSIDECGNSNNAILFVALVDTIAPILHGIPADVTVNCNELPEIPVSIFATDECLCACVVEYQQSVTLEGCQDGQIITRTWTAMDRCGNIGTATQTITLIDEAGPELTIVIPEISNIENGAVLTYTCTEGGIPPVFDFITEQSVVGTATCGGTVSLKFESDTHKANNCDFFGYIEQRSFTWEATDECNNVTTLSITVQLIDDEAPVFTSIPEIACIGDDLFDSVVATDNCGHASIRFWDTQISNPCGAGNAVRRTYEAFDNCGNITRDTTILIPNDQTGPTLQFKDPLMASIIEGEFIVSNCEVNSNGYTSFGVNDVLLEGACVNESSISFSEHLISTSDCLSGNGVIAVVELRWIAEDLCGNTSSLVVTAHVIDDSAPVLINFSPEIWIGCNEEMPHITATDKCGEVTMASTMTIIAGECASEYTIQRLVSATDLCGNNVTGLQTIHVGNAGGPTILGVEEQVCDDLTIPVVTAYDACAEEFVEVSMEEDTLDVQCRDGFVLRRTWTAIDLCGHITTIIQIITIHDQNPPEITVPPYSVIDMFLDNENNLVHLSQFGLIDKLDALNENSVFIYDECDELIIPDFSIQIILAENCVDSGYFEQRIYTWVAVDACGNADTLTFKINIKDDVPPVFMNIPNDTLIVCAPLPILPDVIAIDSSQSVTIVYTQTIGGDDGTGRFVVIRKWVATDVCGNSSIEEQIITWIPDSYLACNILEPEIFDCNMHGVIIGSNIIGGTGPFTYVWEIVGEKCFIQTGQGTPEIEIYVGWTNVKIILTVTDTFGCVSMCMIILDCLEDPLMPLTAFQESVLSIDGEKNVPINPATLDLTNELTDLLIWPNPANENINLSLHSSVEQEIQITMINYLGQSVISNKLQLLPGKNNTMIKTAALPSGSYIMKITNQKESYSRTVLIMQ